MSVAGVHRQYGLGADGAPASPARRGVEREDVAYAIAHRPRLGWQTIAHIRGVNRTDLEAAVNSFLNPASPKRADKIPGQPVTTAMRVLALALDGASGPAAIARQLGLTENSIGCLVHRLKADGLLKGHAARGWAVTAAGRKALSDAGLCDG